MKTKEPPVPFESPLKERFQSKRTPSPLRKSRSFDVSKSLQSHSEDTREISVGKSLFSMLKLKPKAASWKDSKKELRPIQEEPDDFETGNLPKFIGPTGEIPAEFEDYSPPPSDLKVRTVHSAPPESNLT